MGWISASCAYRIMAAGGDFRLQRIAVVRRAAFQHVTDEDFLFGPAAFADRPAQAAAPSGRRRDALAVFIAPWRFANERNRRTDRSLARYSMRAALVQGQAVQRLTSSAIAASNSLGGSRMHLV